MILSQVQAACYRRLGFGTSPGSEVVTRILGFINDTHKEILADPVLSKLRFRPGIAFSTVADSPYCVLPRAVTRLYKVVDRTNNRVLDDLNTVSLIRDLDPGQTVTTSTPEGFSVIDYMAPIAKQPSDSSQLLVKSSDAADTTQTAYIEVIDSDGEIRTGSVSLNGTTAANLGPADSVTIIDFYLSAAPAGEVTLHEDTGGGTELAKIGIGMTRAHYTMLEMYPIPSTALTLYADADIFITDLVNAGDECFIPDENIEALIRGVRAKEFDKREKFKAAAKEEAAMRALLAPLKHQMHRRSSNPVTPQGQIRRSQLGPYFPPGS